MGEENITSIFHPQDQFIVIQLHIDSDTSGFTTNLTLVHSTALVTLEMIDFNESGLTASCLK